MRSLWTRFWRTNQPSRLPKMWQSHASSGEAVIIGNANIICRRQTSLKNLVLRNEVFSGAGGGMCLLRIHLARWQASSHLLLKNSRNRLFFFTQKPPWGSNPLLKTKRAQHKVAPFCLELVEGFEPSAYWLRISCATPAPHQQYYHIILPQISPFVKR